MVKAVHKYEDETFGTLHDTPAEAIEAENRHVDIANVSKKIVMDDEFELPEIAYYAGFSDGHDLKNYGNVLWNIVFAVVGFIFGMLFLYMLGGI